MPISKDDGDRVVITGVGLVTGLGVGRESTWRAMAAGRSGVRRLGQIDGFAPDSLAVTVEGLAGRFGSEAPTLALARSAVTEALLDACLEPGAGPIPREQIGFFHATHIAETRHLGSLGGYGPQAPQGYWPWWEQWMPNTACAHVGAELGLFGPRVSASAACASSAISLWQGFAAVRDRQCDAAVVGAAEALNPLMAAGFRAMRVLAEGDEPEHASRPFDSRRSGFVVGEGAGALVVERLESARRRGAAIYAEVLAVGLMNDSHHITGLDVESSALPRLISSTIRRAGLTPGDIDLVSAHATGTQQNDRLEAIALRAALGSAADGVSVVANKSAIGHLVNAAGAVELGLTAMALRDGFAPPTLNLTDPDPECDLDCTPLVGRERPIRHAIKLSVAFGGHLVAVAMRRWTGPGERAAQRLVAAPRTANKRRAVA